MTHRDTLWDRPRRPPTGRGGDRNGGLPRLSDGVAPAPPDAAV